MQTPEPQTENAGPKECWSVVVIYEDKPARARAMAVCDHLMEQFWPEVEFSFHWWRSDFLEDFALSEAAAESAAGADFILVSGDSERDFSSGIRRWFETCCIRRGRREGALLDLTGSIASQSGDLSRKHAFLRDFARRASLEYLARLPTGANGLLPDSFETVTLRATQTTAVLDDILHQSPPPPHFGLND